MSLKFMEMVADINQRRYLKQIEYLINKKIPCGFFSGFKIDPDTPKNFKAVKDWGMNFTCIVVPVDEMKNIFENLGVPVVTLNEISKAKLKLILYVGDWLENCFTNYFRRFGIDALSIQNSDDAENFFDFHLNNLPKLYSVYEMLADEESKEVYRAYITGRLTGRISDYKFAPESQYFLEGFLPTEGDIAIDGGAYDGATSRDFSMQGAKVYAFEMSATNYKNCLARAEKYNFVIENIGLSNREGEENYIGGGVGSRKGIGNEIGNFIDLDTYVLKKDLPRVDYIKLDIEGSELDMLHGAAKTISRWKPKMAISAYHKPEDLFTLANYVKSLRTDYEIKFRHYKIDATDYLFGDVEREILKIFGLDYFVPSACESVLYCR